MSAIQELSPFLSQFTDRIRQAKDEQHLTIDVIVEKSGVSVSNVTKIVSGSQSDPRLSNAAAICQTLNLSLDEVTGLVPPAPADTELAAQLLESQLREANKDGQLIELHARLKAILPLVYSLCGLCIMLAMGLTVYLLGDSQYPDVGLIKWGEISGPAWVLICIIVASVGTTALLVYRVLHPNAGRKNKNEYLHQM